MPLNHRKTSRMRVETMMRAHTTDRGGDVVSCLAGGEFISRKKKFNLYLAAVSFPPSRRLFHNPVD